MPDRPPTVPEPKTLPEKVWERHLVHSAPGEPDLLYIDLHLVHEVTSPQAFDGLRINGRTVRRPDLTIAVADHNVPTANRAAGITDEESRIQVETLEANVREFGVACQPGADRAHRGDAEQRFHADGDRHGHRLVG